MATIKANANKLILCRNIKYGKCPLGNSCNFAHSEEEIDKLLQMLIMDIKNKVRIELEGEIKKQSENIINEEVEKRIKGKGTKVIEEFTPILIEENKLLEPIHKYDPKYVCIIVELGRIKFFVEKLVKHIPVFNEFALYIEKFIKGPITDVYISELVITIDNVFKEFIVTSLKYLTPKYDTNKDINKLIFNLKDYLYPYSRINPFFEVVTELGNIDMNNINLDKVDDILFSFRKSLKQIVAEIAPDDSVEDILEMKATYPRNITDN